uniref:Integrase catalytic domain-containing protein n=1 Tax=Strongyloides venezuelensis TaxID=75913 RepID=A0A0K0EVG7_STRVS
MLDYAFYYDIYDLLDAIDGRFNKPVLTQVIGLKRKLYCQNFTNVTDLITETNKIILQLKKLNQPITDKEVAHITFATLPQFYESFISSLEMDTELKFNNDFYIYHISMKILKNQLCTLKKIIQKDHQIHFANQCLSKNFEHRTQIKCSCILKSTFLKNVKNISLKILKTADGSKVQVNKAGTLSLLGQELHDVLYVPQFHTNLLSLGKLIQNFNLDKKDGNLFLKSSNINIPVLTINNMLTINLQQDVCLNLTKCDDTDSFHKRFGHTNLKSMKKALHRTFKNISSSCSSCLATKILKAIKSKSDTFNALCVIVNDLENSSGFKVKFFNTDNGLKFCIKNFINWTRSKGIVRITTIAHTPEANPVERYIRTLKNMCGVILYD